MAAGSIPEHERGSSGASEPRHALVAARRRAGLSQEALAEAVEVAVSTVKRWERGATTPYDRQRVGLAEALGVTLAALDGILAGGPAPAPPPAPLGRLDHDPAEATTGARAAMEAFRIADRAGAGVELFAEASRFAESYAGRLVAAGGTTGPILVAVAGLTELVGWLAHDTGPGDDLAGRHFTRARDLAVAGGDLQLAAHAGASLAHLLARNGHGPAALEAADRALVDLGRSARPGAVDSHVEAMRARALALVGRAAEARASLRAAAAHLDHNGVERSPWIHSFDAASLAAEAARALSDLGDNRGAISEIVTIAEHRAEASRAWALGSIRRAVCLARIGDVDEAAGVGAAVAVAPWAARSTVIAAALDELEEALAGYSSANSVQQFRLIRRQ